jgi:hypothetical protein
MRNNGNRTLLQAGLATVIVIGAGSTASVALAQDIDAAQDRTTDQFARDRAVGVRERSRPDYEAVGARYKAFTFYPKVQADVEFNTNVFATETDERDDVIFRVRPEVMAESDWSRHYATGYVRGTVSRNVDYETENSTEWTVGGRGRVDIVRGANITAGGDYGQYVEARTSTNTAISSLEPVEYDMGQAYVAGARTRGRVKLAARADYRTFDYQDAATALGTVIEQDDRDRNISSLVGRIDYAISPATAIFGQVTGNERSYDGGSPLPGRDSTGYEALTGLNFELGAVSRGEIAVGYISQDFDNPIFNDIDGFGARGQVEWFPTELTTITASAARTVEDAGVIGAAGYLRSEASITVDHELLRNVILNSRLSYADDDYNGVDRSDARFLASVGGTYLISRNFGLSGSVMYLDQSSDGASSGPNYSVTRLLVSLVTQF